MATAQIGIADDSANSTSLVELTQFGARTTSRIVAEAFEKEHRTVLRTIDEILETKPELRAHNFVRTEDTAIVGVAPRSLRFYEMDRDGFTLLAMGFTGPKALDWKLAFIDAFNRMEAALTAAKVPALQQVDPYADPRRILAATRAVEAAMRIYGPRGADEVWRHMGMPPVSAEATDPLYIKVERLVELEDLVNIEQLLMQVSDRARFQPRTRQRVVAILNALGFQEKMVRTSFVGRPEPRFVREA